MILDQSPPTTEQRSEIANELALCAGKLKRLLGAKLFVVDLDVKLFSGERLGHQFDAVEADFLSDGPG